MMNKTIGIMSALLLVAYSDTGMAHDEEPEDGAGGPFAESNFSGTFGLTSNFMYRGISFSNDKTTGWGSLDWSGDHWFAGIYSIALVDQDGNGYETEIDYYFGYANTIGKLDWFVQPIYYDYIDCDARVAGLFFGADRDLTCEFVELWLDGTYPITDSISLHAWYAYTPDFEFESGTGHYLKADVTFELGNSGFTLNLGAGHQDVEGGDYSLSFGGTEEEFGWHYVHYELGLSKSWRGFDFDLRYHNTDSTDLTDTLRNYIPDPAFTDDEVVWTISRSF